VKNISRVIHIYGKSAEVLWRLLSHFISKRKDKYGVVVKLKLRCQLKDLMIAYAENWDSIYRERYVHSCTSHATLYSDQLILTSVAHPYLSQVCRCRSSPSEQRLSWSHQWHTNGVQLVAFRHEAHEFWMIHAACKTALAYSTCMRIAYIPSTEGIHNIEELYDKEGKPAEDQSHLGPYI